MLYLQSNASRLLRLQSPTALFFIVPPQGHYWFSHGAPHRSSLLNLSKSRSQQRLYNFTTSTADESHDRVDMGPFRPGCVVLCHRDRPPSQPARLWEEGSWRSWKGSFRLWAGPSDNSNDMTTTFLWLALLSHECTHAEGACLTGRQPEAAHGTLPFSSDMGNTINQSIRQRGYGPSLSRWWWWWWWWLSLEVDSVV